MGVVAQWTVVRLKVAAELPTALLLLHAVPVIGQTSAPDQTDIIVTAQKREQAAQDVGMSIVSVSGDVARARGIDTIEDLTRAVPGLTFTKTPAGPPVLTLRGVGFYDSTLSASPAVSAYLDEAPLALPSFLEVGVIDIDRVEVLKGPQGTLYGENSTGGAINYIAAKPTDTLREGATLSFGRFATFEGEGYVSGPLTDTLKARLALKTVQSGDWQRSYTRDDTNGATHQGAARMILEWQPRAGPPASPLRSAPFGRFPRTADCVSSLRRMTQPDAPTYLPPQTLADGPKGVLDLLPEPVRLVVWDLDETFWKGTLTEGGAEIVPEHERIVIELVHRGIMSAICSKNDHDAVIRMFFGRPVWDHMIFPQIDWETKGPKLRRLIEEVGLRPESVLFLDDNHMIREEARHFVPGLQVASEAVIPLMLDHPMFRGKPDPELKRLHQYKLLERRASDAGTVAGGTEDFLRDSRITVEIDYDVEKHLDRAIELINRTNQLNFTKNRLPDDIDLAHATLRDILGRYNIQSGLVRVRDRYGDYGIVGLYIEEKSVHPGSHLYQFCFSCRILGMKIETWLYRMLGRPPIGLAANVVSDIMDVETEIDWITLVHTSEGEIEPSQRPIHGTTVLLRGGCEMMPLEHYCEQIAETTIGELAYNREGVQLRREHSQFARYAIDPAPAEAMASFMHLGYAREDFMSEVFSGACPNGVRICSFWTDYSYRLYRHRRTGALIPFNAFPATGPHQDLTRFPIASLPEEYRDHWVAGALKHLTEEYDDAGVISKADYMSNLRILLGAISPTSPIFIIGANELDVANASGERPMRYWLREFNSYTKGICADFPNAHFIDAADYLNAESDVDPGEADHFKRIVYYRIFRIVSDIMARRADTQRASDALNSILLR